MVDEIDRTRRISGWAGTVALVFFIGGNLLWAFEQPDAGAGVGEIVGFYEESSGRIVIGASLSLVSIAAMVLFASGARTILRDVGGDEMLANTAFGGAVLIAAVGLGAETINMVGALRAEDGQLTGALAQAVFEISYVLGYNAAGVGIAVFVLATAAVALRSGALFPRWFAVITIVLGVALLTPLSQVLLGPAILLLTVIALLLIRGSSAG